MAPPTNPVRLRLREYETTLNVALCVAQRDRLRRVAPSIAITPATGEQGLYDLTPGSHVGSVYLGAGLELVIRPKLPIDRVLFLVSYAIDRSRWQHAPAGLAAADSLVETILPAYTERLRRALAQGVLQGYRSVDEPLTTLRGRWRIGDQIRDHFGTMPPLEVTYDDYTEDIQLNRLLRAALHRLLALPLRSDRLRWPLQAIDGKLANVQRVEYAPRRIPDPLLDRRSEHYRGAIDLARLILANSAFDLAPGEAPASAFLVDMNRVFQDFLVTALREALGVTAQVLVEEPRGLFLDLGRTVRLAPDLSLWSGGRCVFVGDVKYKGLGSKNPPNDDLYQLLAYTIATDLPSGMLIYAGGDAGGAAVSVSAAGRTLEAVTLDLSAPPPQILLCVDRIAARIRSRISEVPLSGRTAAGGAGRAVARAPGSS